MRTAHLRDRRDLDHQCSSSSRFPGSPPSVGGSGDNAAIRRSVHPGSPGQRLIPPAGWPAPNRPRRGSGSDACLPPPRSPPAAPRPTSGRSTRPGSGPGSPRGPARMCRPTARSKHSNSRARRCRRPRADQIVARPHAIVGDRRDEIKQDLDIREGLPIALDPVELLGVVRDAAAEGHTPGPPAYPVRVELVRALPADLLRIDRPAVVVLPDEPVGGDSVAALAGVVLQRDEVDPERFGQSAGLQAPLVVDGQRMGPGVEFLGVAGDLPDLRGGEELGPLERDVPGDVPVRRQPRHGVADVGLLGLEVGPLGAHRAADIRDEPVEVEPVRRPRLQPPEYFIDVPPGGHVGPRIVAPDDRVEAVVRQSIPLPVLQQPPLPEGRAAEVESAGAPECLVDRRLPPGRRGGERLAEVAAPRVEPLAAGVPEPVAVDAQGAGLRALGEAVESAARAGGAVGERAGERPGADLVGHEPQLPDVATLSALAVVEAEEPHDPPLRAGEDRLQLDVPERVGVGLRILEAGLESAPERDGRAERPAISRRPCQCRRRSEEGHRGGRAGHGDPGVPQRVGANAGLRAPRLG